MRTLKTLRETLRQIGGVEWIGVRTERQAPMTIVEQVAANGQQGLVGDRYSGRTGERHVTIIQAEHLPVIASCLGLESIAPESLRRNLVVRGLNLLALRDRIVLVGDVEMVVTGLCHPCSRMEQTFGSGGYNAVRGHGGITARVCTPGVIRVGDQVQVVGVS